MGKNVEGSKDGLDDVGDVDKDGFSLVGATLGTEEETSNIVNVEKSKNI